MANVFGDTFWVIDTPSATPITTDAVRVDQIVWVPGTAAIAGDECKVTDNASTPNVIYDHFASGASNEMQVIKLSSKTPINGLIVPTLGHGKVEIYLQ